MNNFHLTVADYWNDASCRRKLSISSFVLDRYAAVLFLCFVVVLKFVCHPRIATVQTFNRRFPTTEGRDTER